MRKLPCVAHGLDLNVGLEPQAPVECPRSTEHSPERRTLGLVELAFGGFWAPECPAYPSSFQNETCHAAPLVYCILKSPSEVHSKSAQSVARQKHEGKSTDGRARRWLFQDANSSRVEDFIVR